MERRLCRWGDSRPIPEVSGNAAVLFTSIAWPQDNSGRLWLSTRTHAWNVPLRGYNFFHTFIQLIGDVLHPKQIVLKGVYSTYTLLFSKRRLIRLQAEQNHQLSLKRRAVSTPAALYRVTPCNLFLSNVWQHSAVCKFMYHTYFITRTVKHLHRLKWLHYLIAQSLLLRRTWNEFLGWLRPYYRQFCTTDIP